MLKDITLGQYFPGNTVAHRLDPRTKLIMVVLYIVALFALLITALWSVNEYTGAVEMTWTFSNIVEAFTDQLYLAVTGRTLLIAVIATVVRSQELGK